MSVYILFGECMLVVGGHSRMEILECISLIPKYHRDL